MSLQTILQRAADSFLIIGIIAAFITMILVVLLFERPYPRIDLGPLGTNPFPVIVSLTVIFIIAIGLNLLFDALARRVGPPFKGAGQ